MNLFQTDQTFIHNILSLETEISTLPGQDLLNKFQALRTQDLNDIKTIEYAFAMIREASWRTLGLKHFPTQLLAGRLLNAGEIVEMKTGEGKTLAATLAAAYNALNKKGAHVVTVNEYLAKRDSTTMGKIYSDLGLTTGLVLEGLTTEERQKNYGTDITYVTNSEIGFDFLRDNCVKSLKDTVLRPFNYCIIDEIDSVLIDEARNPLIIADNKSIPTSKYQEAQAITSCLIKDRDFNIDQKLGQASLTDQGIFKLEILLNIENLFDMKNPWIPFLINALKANYLFQRNKDYVVLNGKICIVDEFTGRIMADRRWSGGLHQAIEAKENIPIQPATQTLASITYQNFFTRYPKMSGMTGTAKTSEEEFKTIYNLSVAVVPTAKPIKREDLSDLVYKNELAKWKAVAQECSDNYRLGRPLLIGTTSVKNSEILSEILVELKIPHQLLNARPENISRESEIIAQAGRKFAITIATNMAGRGTDIILGGNLKYLVTQTIQNIIQKNNLLLLENWGCPELNILFQKCWNLKEKELITENDIIKSLRALPERSNNLLDDVLPDIYKKVHEQLYPIWVKENKEVKQLGGLYVIGTERHESSRIDNQLRGRAGRQGDPGKSRFFLCLEDELLQNFGGQRIQNMMSTLNFEDNQPLESSFLTQSVTQAQLKVESFYSETRKRLFDYDEALNLHREFIFSERQNLLRKSFFADTVIQYSEDLLLLFMQGKNKTSLRNPEDQLLIQMYANRELEGSLDVANLEEWLVEQLWVSQDLNLLSEETFGNWYFDIQQDFALQIIDKAWVQHLENMDVLKDSIGWKGYEQRDPLLFYNEASYQLFLEMIEQIRSQFLRFNQLAPFIMV